MKTKERYNAPQTEIIRIETEGIIAGSLTTYNDDEHIVNGAGRAKSFWDNE